MLRYNVLEVLEFFPSLLMVAPNSDDREEEKNNLPQRTQRAQRKNIINSLACGIRVFCGQNDVQLNSAIRNPFGDVRKEVD